MQLYSCKVRLAGSVLNEVRKPEVTVPEIYVLRHLHGEDAVLEIKPLRKEAMDPGPEDEDGNPTKPVLRTDRAERQRLAELYDPEGMKGLLTTLFGVGGMPLPQVIEGVGGAVIPDAPARVAKKTSVAEMVA